MTNTAPLTQAEKLEFIKQKVKTSLHDVDWNPNTCKCDRCSACSQGGWPMIPVQLSHVMMALGWCMEVSWDIWDVLTFISQRNGTRGYWQLNRTLDGQGSELIDFLYAAFSSK